MNTLIIIASIVISAVIFFFIGVAYRKKIAESKIQSAEEEAKKIIELANKDAENKKKEEKNSAIVRNIMYNNIQITGRGIRGKGKGIVLWIE